jgi:hypothetical protein
MNPKNTTHTADSGVLRDYWTVTQRRLPKYSLKFFASVAEQIEVLLTEQYDNM